MRQELAEGVGRGGEAAGHAHAGGGQLADHFAEGGVLAADRLDVGHSQVFKRYDQGGRQVGWMTWESSVMMKNRCFPTPPRGARGRDGVQDGSDPLARAAALVRVASGRGASFMGGGSWKDRPILRAELALIIGEPRPR